MVTSIALLTNIIRITLRGFMIRAHTNIAKTLLKFYLISF